MNHSPPEFTELHAWVADEAAALATHLVNARAEAAVRRLDEARKAIDAAAGSIEAVPVELAIPEDEMRLLKERLSSHAGLDALRVQLQEQAAENQRLADALTTAEADLDTGRAELRAERERAETVRAEMARMTSEFEGTLDELRQEQAAVVGEQARAYSALPLDALLTIFNALRRSDTLAEVLTTLVNGIAREFSRVALFDVQGTHLQGSQQVGFDFESDISRVMIPLSVDSLLARAASSGRLETFFVGLHSSESGVTMPFGGTPACALAIPIVVQGATVAIIYADDSDNPEFATSAPQTRAKFAELLQQHALLVLLRIGVRQKTFAELREFVSLLVDELEYTHAADVNAGKNPLERQQGLKYNLERSSRIYAARIAREGHTTAITLLEEHLRSVADARGDTAFGRDLAAVLGFVSAGPRASVLMMRR